MKKTLAVFAVVALLVALLPASAALANGADSTYDRMMAAVAALDGLDGNEDADKKVDKAGEQLAKGLDPARFDADGEPVDKKVLDALKKAAKELAKAGEKDPDLDTALVEELVDTARTAALRALAAAEDRGAAAKDLEKVNEELAKATDEEKADKAMDRYKKAWQRAVNAKAPGSSSDGGGSEGGGDGGKYAAYTFHFIDLDTNEEMTISGHNAFGSDGYTGKSNEGFMYVNEKFGTIQLHVSCSDAFTDGTGDKSDPGEDTSLRVLWAEITKYDNGEINKECQISGLEDPPVIGTPGDPIG
ncbi:MAG: hypothetical protein HKN01_11575 [Acidimicrobiia bacterium]|nr:hypothetical protein [Acidimicrobiia bacterium]